MAPRSLNPTAASLLGFLHFGAMTGWDLVATAQTVIGNYWTLTQSQVYRELAAMAGAGLVAEGERGRRDSKPYSLTDQGRAAFAEWVRREPADETIRFPLLLTIIFGRHLEPERLAEIVARHRSTHRERLARYEAVRAEALGPDGEADVYGLATLDFGLHYERAVLAWFDQLPTEIRGPGSAVQAEST
ncbi:MAG: PadR family transcriptional regulator [Geodermatophilaceae bacterium]|nr:PadR family transcriptional regulator [Geodermatophilaceae bacterium]